MRSMSKLLCCLLAVLLCMSLVACTRQVVTESWVSVTESGSQGGDDNQNNDDTSTESGNNETSATEGSDKNPDNSETTPTDDDSQNSGGQTESNQTQSNKTETNKTQSGTTNAGVQNTPSSTKRRGDNDTVYREVTLKSGNTKVETTAKTALKGKTYNAIIWTEIKEGFQEELDAFGDQYGCNIKMDSVNFESVNTTVSNKLASGEAYDLIRIQGSWYPRILTQGLLAPLQGAFTQADLLDSKKDGIDLTKSKYFGWNNNLYAITTYDDSPIYYLYYNKSILGESINKLVKQNKWNWQTMKDMAAQYTGPDSPGRAYWSDASFYKKALPLSNSVSLLKETKKSDGGVKLEVSISGNTNFINSLRYLQGLEGLGNGTGLYAPKQVLATDGGGDKFENLLTGKIVVWPAESSRFLKLYAQIKTAGTAFANNPNNLAVAPMPTGPDNDGSYAAGWLTAYAAGKGSDATAPTLVAAFAKFHSTYSVEGSNALEKQAAAAAAKVKSSMYHLYANTNYCDFGYGPTRQENMDIMLNAIELDSAAGKDITSTLKKYENQAAGYLRASLSEQ